MTVFRDLGKDLAHIFTQTEVLRDLGKDLACIFTQTDVFRKLGKYLLEIFTQVTIFHDSGKEFHKKRFIFSGLCVLSREGMPPPVVSAAGQRAVQHKRISA